MENNAEAGTLWATIGKLSVVAGIIGTVVGVWNVVAEPRSEVIAYVSSYPFSLPPTFWEDLQIVDSLARQRGSRASNQWRPGTFTKGELERFYRSIGVMQEISIVNNGDRVALDVSLKLPRGVLASLDRDGVLPKVIRPQGLDLVVDVGNLRPSEIISIRAWNFGRGFRLSPDDLEDMRLIHREGTGTIIGLATISPLWLQLEPYRILILGWASVGAAGALYFLGRSARKTILGFSRRKE
jgi:hypothetical protein